MARRPTFGDEPMSRLAALVGPAGAVRARGGGAVGRHRALRPAGDRAGARHFRRRADFRRARRAAVVLRLRRDLAAGPRRARLGDLGCARPRCCSPIRAISAIAPASCRRSPTSPPTRPIRRASTCWRACARAAATTIRARRPRASSRRPIPTSRRCSVDARRSSSPTTSTLALVDQTQMARGRCPSAGRRPARRRHRGGGAHADHGFPRRRGDARERGRRRRAHRRALGLALRPARFRHQCRAHRAACSTTSTTR